jgi:putative intracellular protease/amidase
MAIELQGQKIAFLATDGVEQVELKEPWKAVADAGGEPELLSIKEERSRGSTTCADVVRDRKLTSWPSLRTDIRNAGGNWVDEEVVVDGGLVSAADRTICQPSARRSSNCSPTARPSSQPRRRALAVRRA